LSKEESRLLAELDVELNEKQEQDSHN